MTQTPFETAALSGDQSHGGDGWNRNSANHLVGGKYRSDEHDEARAMVPTEHAGVGGINRNDKLGGDRRRSSTDSSRRAWTKWFRGLGDILGSL